MGNSRKLIIGEKFILKCGTEVTVVDASNCRKVVIEDSEGVRKFTRKHRLLDGEFSWFTKGESVRDLIGKTFTLNCGVIVTVLPSDHNSRISIADKFGNKKMTTKFTLLSGSISWTEFGYGLPVSVGQGFLLNSGIHVTVKSYTNNKEVVVVDQFGTEVNTTISSLKAGSIRWPVTEHEQFAYGRRMCRLGDEYELRCGVVVKIIYFENEGKVTIQDEFGNTKVAQLGLIKSGGVSWKEFGFPSRKHGEPLKPGHKFTIKSGIELEVVEYKSVSEVLIKDVEGNSKYTSATSVYNCTVSWGEFKGQAWNYLKVDVTKHYVYIVKHRDIVLYVGKGKGNRYVHPNSGKSHCLELNRLYFSGVPIEISIYSECETSEDAIKLEKKVIKELDPIYNKMERAVKK